MIRKVTLFMALLTVFYGVLSSQTAVRRRNELILEQGDVTVSISAAEDFTLRIRARSGSTPAVLSPFFIKKKTRLLPVGQVENKWKIGPYLVQPDEKGFTLYREGKILFSSEFVQDGQIFREVKRCRDKELFYGVGQGADRFVLSRYKVSVFQQARYGNRACLTIPFFFTSGGDAFYHDAFCPDQLSFRNRASGEMFYRTREKVIQYYYYHEPDPKTLVSRFYHFSRSASLLPKWAFGYIQSKYGYKNEKEVYEIADTFKKYDIPVSAIVLDLQWFKHMGDLAYDKENWPAPLKMDRYLEDRGIKLITISEPFYTVDSKNYAQFDANGLFGKNKEGKTFTWNDWWCFDSTHGAIVNPIAPKARELLGQKYIDMVNWGIDAFWTDLGEPEGTSPDLYFNQFKEKEFHNYYNREWSRLIHDAVLERFPDRRVFILSRSGFTGSSRYGVSVWSGDCMSSFLGLDLQITLGLNAGLTGFSYWGSDVGGFESGKKIPEKELFIRWMQFGTFTPVFRAHGAMSAREPWIHGKEALKIIKNFIETRYRLLPYIYSTAYQTYKQGLPMMRPLFMEHPRDPHPNVTEYASQYYFGDSLLVVPVTSPIAESPETDVYLPKGQWYDFYSHQPIKAGEHSIKSELEKIPVFIKAGAIIPIKEKDKHILLLAPTKKESTFTWYDDDGITNGYKKGKFEAITIHLQKNKLTLTNVKTKKELHLKILGKKTKEKTIKIKPGVNIIKI